jgi:hypothetical protein
MKKLLIIGAGGFGRELYASIPIAVGAGSWRDSWTIAPKP